MIGFWILAALVAAAAAFLIMRRAAAAARGEPAQDPARAVYARQLDEIDDLARRGLIGDEEQQAARAEAARRLIGAAAAAPEPVDADPRAARTAVLAVTLAAPLLALGVYLATGSPRLADQPFAARLAAWRKADPSTLDAAQLAALLEQVSAERPTDPEPLLYLARAEQAQGQDALAVHTLERAVKLAPRRADAWAALGDGLATLGGGAMTPDARRAFEQALALDPKAPLPRYRLARADIAAGRAAQGLAAWRALEADLPAQDPRRAGLAQEIAIVERTGALPPDSAPAAPTEAPGAAADQRAFIQSMVDRLAARLKTQPEDPDGWARLIHAYGVLGETDRQRAAIAEVERRYAGRPSIMRSILERR